MLGGDDLNTDFQIWLKKTLLVSILSFLTGDIVAYTVFTKARLCLSEILSNSVQQFRGGLSYLLVYFTLSKSRIH